MQLKEVRLKNIGLHSQNTLNILELKTNVFM